MERIKSPRRAGSSPAAPASPYGCRPLPAVGLDRPPRIRWIEATSRAASWSRRSPNRSARWIDASVRPAPISRSGIWQSADRSEEKRPGKYRTTFSASIPDSPMIPNDAPYRAVGARSPRSHSSRRATGPSQPGRPEKAHFADRRRRRCGFARMRHATHGPLTGVLRQPHLPSTICL